MRRLPKGYSWERGCIRIRKTATINGKKRAIRLRTQATSAAEAERIYIAELERLRREDTDEKTFADACERYADTQEHLATYADNIALLADVVELVGHLPLSHIHDETLAPVRAMWDGRGLKPKTVNTYLAIISRVLTLSARSWRDADGRPLLRGTPPLLTRPTARDVASQSAKPYPLEWAEQGRLLAALPDWFASWALFAVNTGAREKEISALRWSDWRKDWGGFWVNGKMRRRFIVCNSVALSVIEARRGRHAERVFARGSGATLDDVKVTDKIWRRAWREAGLPEGREWLRGVHNLRHTYGHRLRSAGVDEYLIRRLLGHASGSVTESYTAPDLRAMRAAAETVVQRRDTTILRAV